ncbi:MAG: DUF501 domain-containing protein [Acidimicrobiia bacterium]
MDDGSVVEVQLGRPLRATSRVEARCHLGLPVVVSVPPILDDGTPFPTLYWLTCPLARRRVGRLEGAGGIKAMDRRVAGDPMFESWVEERHRRYAQERDELVPPEAEYRPTGGVGGTEGPGIKCLHAHLADTLAGNDNPVGELVAPWVGPLDCAMPCVIDDEGSVVNNPEWQEPA